MINVTRTIYGAQLQANLYFGIPHNPMPKTTLNELYNIHDQVNLLSTEVPSLEYFGIGNGGHRIVATDFGGKTSTVVHRASDAGSYRPLPFILRDLNNDLSPVEQAKYGMRTIMPVEGVNKIAYMLKKIDKSNMASELRLTTIANSIKTTIPFVPNNDNLSPLQPVIPNEGAITSDGSYLSTVTALDLSLTAQDIQEIVDAATAIYNDPEAAIISEISMVSAYVKTVSILDQNRQPASGTYKEAIKAQITSHGTTYHQLTQANNGLELLIDMGASEPMFGPTITTVSGT